MNVPKLRFRDEDGTKFPEWKITTLGDIAKFRRGSFPQPYGLSKWYDDANGMPFIQVFDVDDNFKLKSITKRRISKEAQEQSVFVKAGSLLVTIQGSIGRIAITQYDAYVDRTLLLFESFKIKIDMFYFAYILFLLFEIEKEKAPGGTIKTITKEVLTYFKVSICDYKEQTKIASLFTAVDMKIDQLTQKFELLNKYKKGVMQQIFSQELRFKDVDGCEFPDWEEKEIGEVFIDYKGKGLSKDKIGGKGKSKCILYGHLFTKYAEVIGEINSWTDIEEGLLSKVGDILMPSSTTTCGIDLAKASYLSESDVLLGGDIIVLRLKTKGNSAFFAYFLSHAKTKEIASVTQGLTIVHLYFSQLKEILISVPSYEEQTKIASFLMAIDDKITATQSQLELVKQYKQGLLQQMFI